MVNVWFTIMMGVSDLFNKADRIASNYWQLARAYVSGNYIGNIYILTDVIPSPPHINSKFGGDIYFKVPDIFPFLRNNVTLIKNVLNNDPSYYAGRWRVGNRFSDDQWNNNQDLFFTDHDIETPGYVQLTKLDVPFNYWVRPIEKNKAYIIISETNIYNTSGDANETYEAEMFLLKLRITHYYAHNKSNVNMAALLILIAIIYLSTDD